MLIPLRVKLEAAALGVALVFGVSMCRAHDTAVAEKAVLADRLAGADRDLSVWLRHAAHSAARVDTLVDTVRTTLATKPGPPSVVTVEQLVLDTVWARRWVDSVERYVAASKRADETCLSLASECALFRIGADSTSRKYERKIALLERMPRGCSLRERGTAGAAGGVLGAVLGAYVRGR